MAPAGPLPGPRLDQRLQTSSRLINVISAFAYWKLEGQSTRSTSEM